MIFLLVLTSLMGYLEWGATKKGAFLWEVESELMSKVFISPASLLHPFVILPLIGQVILIIALFQSKPSKLVITIAAAFLALLLGFMLFIGMISLNYKIVSSTLPFFFVLMWVIRYFRRNIG
ncbi:MAG: hypothetical protein SFU27_04095 [Thermonemataceae bacterium]|nr:hypothetical protein [Thermonemataceae bacterium]